MTSSNHQVRRATVDDLVFLRRLWQKTELPLASLEKQLREFQVIETPDGQLLGAVGLKVDGLHGWIYAEAYAEPAAAEELRPRLWERLQVLARNHGLCRLWVQTKAGLFWLERGFEAAGTDLLANLPKTFNGSNPGGWLTLKLRDEPPAALSIEHEMELFRNSQREQSERVLRQARMLRLVAAMICVAILVLVGCAMWYAFRLRAQLGR